MGDKRGKKRSGRWAAAFAAAVLMGYGVRLLAAPEPVGQVSDRVRGIPGPVTCLLPACDGTEIYAGTGKGVYRSLDGGHNWERIFRSGLWRGPVRNLAWDPVGQSLYVAASNGLYQYSGKAWTKIRAASAGILCIAASFSEPGVLLAGTSKGIMASRDRGKTWEGTFSGLPIGSVREILFDPVREGRCYLAADTGYFQSDDCGWSWTRMSLPGLAREEAERGEDGLPEEEADPPIFLPLAVDRRGKIFIGDGVRILKSDDGGRTWQPLPNPGFGPSTHLLCDPLREGLLYAAARSGLFMHSAEWNAWRPVIEGWGAGEIFSLAADPGNGELWVGTRKSLLRLLRAPEGIVPHAPASYEGQGPVDTGPSITAVHQAAIRYAEVQPEKIRRWRASARWKALFPTFNVGLDQDRDRTVVSSTQAGVTRFSVGPDRRTMSLDFGFSWDLADLIWNPEQTSIDVRSRLMVQLRQDVLEEANRLYFERRRLLAEFAAHPAGDPALLRERGLRIEELTAHLDALTGGWFSEND